MFRHIPGYASLLIEGTSGPPLTERQIADFERTFDTVIPPPYKDLLLCRNGGVLARNVFKTPNFDVFLMYLPGIGPGIRPDFDRLDDLDNGLVSHSLRVRSWRLPDDIFPFAQLGHFFCYLKKDATRECSPVYCVFTEIPDAYEHYRLTDTFAEFINSLKSSPASEIMVEMFREANFPTREGE